MRRCKGPALPQRVACNSGMPNCLGEVHVEYVSLKLTLAYKYKADSASPSLPNVNPAKPKWLRELTLQDVSCQWALASSARAMPSQKTAQLRNLH